MILTIAAVLFILWVLGLIVHVGGGLINILIVLALVSVIYHFARGTRHTV